MKGTYLIPSLTVLLSYVVSVHGAVAAWGQCGGIGHSGETVCVSGHACIKLNDYYSQCQPGTAPPVTTPPPVVTPPPPTGTVTPPITVTATGTTPTGTGQLIRGVTAPVFHLYLQNLGGIPHLGPENSGRRYIIAGSIRDTGSGLYMNIDTASTSYKPLSFGTTATTTGWGLEGDTIITTNASPWGRQLNFLACTTSTSGYYRLYLQTGNDTPSGQSCTRQTIHLPCLC